MAGSTTFVSEIISRCVKIGLLSFDEAVKMASANICFTEKPNAKIYWDENLVVKAIKLNEEMIAF